MVNKFCRICANRLTLFPLHLGGKVICFKQDIVVDSFVGYNILCLCKGGVDKYVLRN